jgi:CRP-like cAMP-binding protein
MRQFWDIVVHMVESLLFISCGLMCAVKNIDMQLELLDFAVLLAIYVMLHVVRAVVVLVVGTISMKAGYGLEFKEGIVVVWAGLTRGAVGLALSLVLASRPTYTDEQKKTNALVLFFCAVITPLTVFLNGGLVQAVICKLGMVYDTPAKQYAVKTAWSRIRLEADHLLETLASETVYGDADWVKIRDNIALPPAESFYTQDAWENVQAIGELLLSPLGFFVSCASSMGLVSEEKTNRSKKAFAIFTPAAVSKPSRASTETREAKENTDAADAAVSPPSNALMNLSNYVSTVSRNKQMFMRLRNAQFQVETRKRIIRLEMTSYLRQYQEGHLARAAVTTLIHDLEHHSDNHKIMSAEDVLGKLKIGSARETLYNWKPPPLAKCLGGGLIKWWAVHSIFQSLTVGFDICVGFMNAKIDVAHSLAEMESHANSLSDDQTTDDEMSQQSQATLEIVAKLKKDVDLQVHEIKKALCVVTAKYPDIMRAVKTRMVSKWLLNTEIEAVTTQFNDEMLDTPDHDKLIGLLKKKKSSIDTTWTIRVKEPTMDEVLQTLPWYAKLSPSAKTALKNIAREIQHQPREYLVQEGENSPSIYILVYGFVEIFHEAAGNVAVQYVGAGTLVGELSLLRSTPCKFSVRTVTATRVCELPGAELLALMDSEPSLEYGLWKICGYRIAKRYLLHNSDMGDDEVSMLDERQSIVTDTVRSSGSQVHDVSALPPFCVRARMCHHIRIVCATC